MEDNEFGVHYEIISSRWFTLGLKGLCFIGIAALWGFMKQDEAVSGNWQDRLGIITAFAAVLVWGLHFFVQIPKKIHFYKKGFIAVSLSGRRRYGYGDISGISDRKENVSYQTLEKMMLYRLITSYTRWTVSFQNGEDLILKSNCYSRLNKKMKYFSDNLVFKKLD